MPSADLPGVPTQADEDYVVREIEAMKRQIRELQPSLMAGVADAISSLVYVAQEYDSSDGFGLSVVHSTLASVTFTLPDSFIDRGAVMVVGSIRAKNTTGGTAELASFIEIGSTGYGPYGGDVVAGLYGFISPSRSHDVVRGADYIGDELTVSLIGYSDTTLAATGDNLATLSVMLVQYRD